MTGGNIGITEALGARSVVWPRVRWLVMWDLLRAWVRYRSVRLCCEVLRWVASWNRRTLTADEGARIIALLKELKEWRENE